MPKQCITFLPWEASAKSDCAAFGSHPNFLGTREPHLAGPISTQLRPGVPLQHPLDSRALWS